MMLAQDDFKINPIVEEEDMETSIGGYASEHKKLRITFGGIN